MKRTRQKNSSKPRPLSIPTGGTDQELCDALEKAIDPATAYILRRQARHRREGDERHHEQEAFVEAFLPLVLKWLRAREAFRESELEAFLRGLNLDCLPWALKGLGVTIFVIEDRSDFPAHTHRFNVETNFGIAARGKDRLFQRVARAEPLAAPGWCPLRSDTWLES